jgi:hypothetical protein
VNRVYRTTVHTRCLGQGQLSFAHPQYSLCEFILHLNSPHCKNAKSSDCYLKQNIKPNILRFLKSSLVADSSPAFLISIEAHGAQVMCQATKPCNTDAVKVSRFVCNDAQTSTTDTASLNKKCTSPPDLHAMCDPR